jgi:hypothetical protein
MLLTAKRFTGSGVRESSARRARLGLTPAANERRGGGAHSPPRAARDSASSPRHERVLARLARPPRAMIVAPAVAGVRGVAAGNKRAITATSAPAFLSP